MLYSIPACVDVAMSSVVAFPQNLAILIFRLIYMLLNVVVVLANTSARVTSDRDVRIGSQCLGS